MPEEILAANEVEVATQQTEEVSTNTEAQGKEDITTTQAFARRLSEATTKAQKQARDELIAEMYGESHGIKTYEEYKEAIKEQELRNKYESKELPEEVVNELVENRKFREKYEAEQESRKSEEAKKKDQLDFLNYFKEVNGRDFDTSKDEIPQEIWDEHAKGGSLKKAYADYYKESEIKRLRAENEELKKGSKAKQANEENSKAATGSVTGNGSAEVGDISFEEFSKNKHDPNWVKKNFTQIMKSRADW